MCIWENAHIYLTILANVEVTLGWETCFCQNPWSPPTSNYIAHCVGEAGSSNCFIIFYQVMAVEYKYLKNAFLEAKHSEGNLVWGAILVKRSCRQSSGQILNSFWYSYLLLSYHSFSRKNTSKCIPRMLWWVFLANQPGCPIALHSNRQSSFINDFSLWSPNELSYSLASPILLKYQRNQILLIRLVLQCVWSASTHHRVDVLGCFIFDFQLGLGSVTKWAAICS